jgi:signal transduction histidine kinase
MVTWVELGYLLLGGITSCLAFAVLLGGGLVGGLLGVTIIGLPALVAAFAVAREMARVERWRTGILRGSVPELYRRPARSGWVARVGAYARDPQTWRDLLWLLLLTPVGFAFAVAAVSLWASTFYLLSTPAWWWAIPDSARGDFGNGWQVDSWMRALAVGGAGLLCLVLTPWICAGLARSQAWLAAVLLRPARLSARVTELTETRAAAADAQTEELRRIERDLHDGAQAQLVALAIDLGLAEQKLDEDPAAARALIESAQEGAKTAIAELRELVRGVHPAILSDRGLDGALAALAARAPVPVELDVQPGERLAPAVETAAYFVVAEALTNVAKHSEAERAEVSVVRDGSLLRIRVEDDGRGGASAALGSGLAGLERRVRALDGSFRLTSPSGGPTALVVEIPCAS